MSLFRSLSRKAPEVEVTSTSVDAAPGAVLTEGSLEFTVAHGGNDSLPSYQEASGAPVETNSPLGYFVGPVTVVFLNISNMVGTGVYSTRKPSGEVDLDASFGLTSFGSCDYPQRHWFSRFGLTILASGVSYLSQLLDGVSGVRRLLPESIWCRSCLS